MLIFTDHVFNVMESIVDEVLVMQRGKIVEYGAAKEVFSSPREAYTRELLKAGRLSSALRLGERQPILVGD